MNLEQFNKLKEQTLANLYRKLDISKDPRLTTYQIVLKGVSKEFRLQDAMQGQLELLKEITKFADSVNGIVTHTSHDDGKGHVGYYDHTTFSVKYYEVVNEITDTLLKDTVHKALRGIMGLSKYSYIDCKLMQLFKDSKLSWEDLVKAHKEDCSL